MREYETKRSKLGLGQQIVSPCGGWSTASLDAPIPDLDLVPSGKR